MKLPTQFLTGCGVGNGWTAFNKGLRGDPSINEMEASPNCVRDASDLGQFYSCVRLHVEPHILYNFESHSMRWDRVDYIRFCVKRLIRQGLWVILDAWHPEVSRYKREWPEFVNLTPNVEPVLASFWNYLAISFKGIKEVAFEIRNEPFDWPNVGRSPDEALLTRWQVEGCQGVLDSIRAVDVTRWVILPGREIEPQYFAATKVVPRPGARTAYAIHANRHEAGSTEIHAVENVGHIRNWQAVHKLPVIATEFSGSVEYVRRFRRDCAFQGIGTVIHEWGQGIPKFKPDGVTLNNEYTVKGDLAKILASV